MNTKKILVGILGLFVLSAGIAFGVTLIKKDQDIREKAAAATVGYISPSSQEVGLGSNFSFSVKMDSGTNSIIGTDIRLSFDTTAFEVTSLEKGQNASNLESTIASTFDNSTGKIKYIIYTTDKTKALSGSGMEILKINARSKSNATKKSYSIIFESQTAASGTSETQNIITTLTPGNVALVDQTSPTSSPYTEGEPNSCGGTCGSKYNCKMDFFCYQGFCRNPKCPTDKTCGCVTPKPTVKPTPTKTPEVTFYGTSILTPRPTIRPTATVTSLPSEPTQTKKLDWIFIGILSAVGASLIFTIWAIIKAFKKPDIPQIS